MPQACWEHAPLTRQPRRKGLAAHLQQGSRPFNARNPKAPVPKRVRLRTCSRAAGLGARGASGMSGSSVLCWLGPEPMGPKEVPALLMLPPCPGCRAAAAAKGEPEPRLGCSEPPVRSPRPAKESGPSPEACRHVGG